MLSHVFYHDWHAVCYDHQRADFAPISKATPPTGFMEQFEGLQIVVEHRLHYRRLAVAIFSIYLGFTCKTQKMSIWFFKILIF